MLRPQHFLPGRQSPAKQRFRSLVIAFVFQQKPKIVHATQRVGVLCAQNILSNLQRYVEQVFRKLPVSASSSQK